MNKKNIAVAALALTLLGAAAPAANAGVSLPADYTTPTTTYTTTTDSWGNVTYTTPTTNVSTQSNTLTVTPTIYQATTGEKATYTNALGRSVEVATTTGDVARDAVVQSALSQLGDYQDCTMLVTNSIKSIGINFHDWPVGYTGLGDRVDASEAKPGDLIYYERNGFTFADGTPQSHIAVYIGDGLAVHGGWMGMGTEIFSVDLPTASAPVFISLDAYQK